MYCILASQFREKFYLAKKIRDVVYELTNKECTVLTIHKNVNISTIVRKLKRRKVTYLIPTYDTSTLWMAKHQDILKREGFRFIISKQSTLETLDDKSTSYEFLRNKILMPDTFTVDTDLCREKVTRWSDKYSFPQYFKIPSGTVSGKGVTKITNKEGLVEVLDTVFGDNERRKYIIQQGIPGKIINCQCIYNEGVLTGLFSSVTESENVQGLLVHDNPYMHPRLTSILKYLGKISGFSGLLDCEFLLYKHKHYLMEINPRMSGGVFMVFEFGIGFFEKYLDLITGSKVVPKMQDFSPENVELKMYNRLLSLRSIVA